MPCIGLWPTFRLERRSGSVDFSRPIRITGGVDPNNPTVVAVDVLNNAGQPMLGRRRLGTCIPRAGNESVLTMIISGGSRDFPVTGIVSPESSASTFTGTYVVDPDTGDTGTGTGSQVTLLGTRGGPTQQRATRSAKKGAATKGAAKKGAAKKGAAKKG